MGNIFVCLRNHEIIRKTYSNKYGIIIALITNRKIYIRKIRNDYKKIKESK